MQFIDLPNQQKKIKNNLFHRITKVLEHGKYIMGPEIQELEKRLADFVGVNHCLTCSSGTDALLIPLMAINVGPGDAVITTPFTFIATAEVISLLGATPIFIDIDSNTFNINPENIIDGVKEAEGKGLMPKAIIPVDLFGLPSNYHQIEAIAKKHELFIIEDAAQGFGGNVRGKMAGSFGDVAATSFFPAKPLGCYGDGGAIFTNYEDHVEIMRSIRVHGCGNGKYDNIRIGINGRLDTLQAAILLEKLNIFPNEIELRNKIADYYSLNLPKNLIMQVIPKDYKSSWAQYSLLSESIEHRNKIMNFLKVKNIPTMIYYKTPLHMQKVFSHLSYTPDYFPIAKNVADRIFSIPMHPYLEIEHQNEILGALHAVA